MRRLPSPASVPSIQVLVSFAEYFEEFFAATANVTAPEGEVDSFAERLTALSPQEIVEIALYGLAGMISHGSNLAIATGVGYQDIANLHKQTEIRASLYYADLPDGMPIYRPQRTRTEAYHMDLFEDQLSHAIGEMFEGANRLKMDSQDDVILWRVLTGIVIEASRAIVFCGEENHISDMQLLNYHIDNAKALNHDPYSYVLTLNGPGM